MTIMSEFQTIKNLSSFIHTPNRILFLPRCYEIANLIDASSCVNWISIAIYEKREQARNEKQLCTHLFWQLTGSLIFSFQLSFTLLKSVLCAVHKVDAFCWWKTKHETLNEKLPFQQLKKAIGDDV